CARQRACSPPKPPEPSHRCGPPSSKTSPPVTPATNVLCTRRRVRQDGQTLFANTVTRGHAAGNPCCVRRRITSVDVSSGSRSSCEQEMLLWKGDAPPASPVGGPPTTCEGGRGWPSAIPAETTATAHSLSPEARSPGHSTASNAR